jgi:hypothetical protein
MIKALMTQGWVVLRWVFREVAQEALQEAVIAGLMLALPF